MKVQADRLLIRRHRPIRSFRPRVVDSSPPRRTQRVGDRDKTKTKKHIPVCNPGAVRVADELVCSPGGERDVVLSTSGGEPKASPELRARTLVIS